MKKKFLFTLMSIVAILTSCNNVEVGGLTANKTTSFNVSVSGVVKSRAAVSDLTRYVMEVYKGATATGTPEMHKEQANGVFTDVVLDNAQQYTVLFWADYGTPSPDGTNNATNEYNAADLKVAQVATGKQPSKAAYAGLSRFTVGTDMEAVYTAVTLTHAVAQVNFEQTEGLTSATNTLTVNYPESYSLNVDGNAITTIAGAVVHNFTYNQKEKGTLGTSYIIAASGAPKTVLEITATLNNESEIAVSNVPFERNFRTNISGSYSNKHEVSLIASCDDAWGTPDVDVDLPSAEAITFFEFLGNSTNSYPPFTNNNPQGWKRTGLNAGNFNYIRLQPGVLTSPEFQAIANEKITFMYDIAAYGTGINGSLTILSVYESGNSTPISEHTLTSSTISNSYIMNQTVEFKVPSASFYITINGKGTGDGKDYKGTRLQNISLVQ